MKTIHVIGYPGCDYKALHTHLVEAFGTTIIVKSTDDFLSSRSTKKSMEASIDEFLSQHTKPVVLIGNVVHDPLKKLFPKFECDYRIWWNVPLRTATENALQKQLDWLCKHNQHFIEMSRNMSRKHLAEYLHKFYDYHQALEHWRPLHAICRDFKYKPMTEAKIVSLVRKETRLH